MVAKPPAIVVADSSVLINFLKVDRVDLLGRLPTRIVITDHVDDEVSRHFADQRARLHAAMKAGHLEQRVVEAGPALPLFGPLIATHRLGVGESSAIAYAVALGAAVALDDRQAIAVAQRLAPSLSVIGTTDLVIAAIRARAIGVAEADKLKADWAKYHRFTIKIGSFRDLL